MPWSFGKGENGFALALYQVAALSSLVFSSLNSI